MGKFNFGPASQHETIVFGSERPGYNLSSIREEDVDQWISFMKERGISRIVCLLDDKHLPLYPSDLLETYAQEFGSKNVLHAPIEDFTLCDADVLKNSILPFLKQADSDGEKVLVHCSGGIGRTGHVLAAWLVYGRGYDPNEAVNAVKNSGADRNPYEAKGSSTKLIPLLESCQP